jgi:hypothetical protein
VRRGVYYYLLSRELEREERKSPGMAWALFDVGIKTEPEKENTTFGCIQENK